MEDWAQTLIDWFCRDFINSIALKEEPESPGTMRKKAQEKRKQAQSNSEDAVDVKKMMSGVSKSYQEHKLQFYAIIFRIINSQIWKLWPCGTALG